MSAKPANRFRPRVEGLEGRELLSTNPVLSLLPTPTRAVVGGVGQTGQNPGVSLRTASLAPSRADCLGFDCTSPVSVVTVQNQTRNPIHYYIKWPGTKRTLYTLQPGKAELHYVPGSGMQALISFDYSFRPGYQERRYTLASKVFAAGGFADLRPTYTTDGQIYNFRLNSARTGIDLFSAE